MKRSTLHFCICLVASLTVAAAQSAQAQVGQYIVSSQVVSDTADAHGHVGDLPVAGCNSCGDHSYGSVGGRFAGAGIAHLGRGCRDGCVGCQSRVYGQPDLFYNFYTSGNCNRVNAQMYLSPRPVPPNVGNTFYTYQPFYPHELLYWHKDRFHNYYDNGRGMNRTRATYFSPPIRQAASNVYWNYLRLPR